MIYSVRAALVTAAFAAGLGFSSIAIAQGPEPEVCLEAATPPVRLSTGDWLHLFAAGTQGWGPWGPGLGGSYSAGWVVLDRDDPTRIIQRSVVHPFKPDMDYEIGSSPRCAASPKIGMMPAEARPSVPVV